MQLLPNLCTHPVASKHRCPPLLPTPQIQLTAEETQGAATASERELLQLVELLVAAGAPCTRFLADCRPAGAAAGGPATAAKGAAGPAAGGGPAAAAGQPDELLPRLVFPSLLLAAGLPGWSPATHRLWPPTFRSAARVALLALRGRGIVAASQTGGSGGTVKRAPGPQVGAGGVARRPARLHLPPELCQLILRKAAATASCWVD